MLKLTERQKLVLGCIANHVKEYGYPPTLRELGDASDIASTHGVHCHLNAIERKGYIRREEYKSRGIVLTDVTREMFGLPTLQPKGNAERALERVFKILDGFPDTVDLSTSTGALQGANTVVLVIEKAIFEGMGRGEGE